MLPTQNYNNIQDKKLVNCEVFRFFILSLSVITIWPIALLHCDWTTVCCLSRPADRVTNSCEVESEEQTAMHREFPVIDMCQNRPSIM